MTDEKPNFDEMLKEIKADIEKDEMDKDFGDRIFSVFNKKTWKYYVFYMVFLTATVIATVWSVVRFYGAETVENMLFWAAHSIILMIIWGFCEIWFYMESNRVSILKQMKRLELQLSLSNDNGLALHNVKDLGKNDESLIEKE